MKTNQIIIFSLIFLSLVFGCKKKAVQTQEEKQNKVKAEHPKSDENSNTEVSQNKEYLKAYYELPHIKEFYDWQGMEYHSGDQIKYSTDLSKLSYDELRLLRNEVYARNGHLFNDGFLRGYFNRFKWYMPIFDVDDFKVMLSDKENDLINNILEEENKRKKQETIPKGDLQLYNSDLIVNLKQFEKVPQKVQEDFKSQNFSIVDANRSMPFYAYDENAYQYIPHYITTDLYLFILHKYFSRSIEKLDENYMYGQLKNILNLASQKLNELSTTESYVKFQPTIEWAQMYSALAQYTMGENGVYIPQSYKSIFNSEKNNIDKLKGRPAFIPNDFVDYQELKPRGHYTKSEILKKYFKGFKWISLNGINLNNREQLNGLITFAYVIKNDKKLHKAYKQYVSTIEKLAGREDNLSLSDIIQLLTGQNLTEVLSDENVALITEELNKLNKEKIKKVFGASFQTTEKEAKRVFFLSSTYSISGDIFSKLIHIDGSKSKRPFPNGLDIPAVFNNKTAKNILINEYTENNDWPDYQVRLNKLEEQFKTFDDWDHNYGFKGVQTALTSFYEEDSYPDYMKTDEYNRKELATSLASWAHIKHDLILYQEKPFAAESGQGGGPKPPQHYSYVEPNLKFWDTALELVEWLEGFSEFESTYKDELNSIKELGSKLRSAAYKQIEGKEITREEYDWLHYVGGTVEYILFGLLETDHLPERERSMALIADVYVYNGTNLNVAVGHADDIYTVVPIKGEYYIARGSVFSYYEFTGGILDDDQWKAKIKNNNIPDRPKWIEPIINYSTPLKGQMQFRY
ncbi:YARHG domain-containing protein [Aquimarina sp. MAR_2010_214]|uniref:DUF3160 domain-containing protein n=1 Tax=Aquimarina sp. MAR_2010_214 TaxID=1250026 RepID=UPI000C711E7E|nr:DUF3160 domain-containing protein [Aquimarina sp. MAR_2010_214]PKV51356.1 YARHG domain-containing protein [Aquimarina sp. MAR_2010_214]